MTYKMNEKQLENVFNLDSKGRYEHFLGKACDWEEVWLLSSSEGHALKICPEENIEYIPVWPHSEYAKEFAKINYENYEPASTDVYSFSNDFLEEIIGTDIKIGVFPNLETTVWLISARDLKEDIIAELKQYE